MKLINKEKNAKPASYKEILKKSFPAILAGMLATLIPFVDNFASGLIGDSSVAIVAYASYITMVFYMASMGFMGMVGIMISQYNGTRDLDRINQLHRFKVIVSSIFNGLGIILFLVIPRVLLGMFTSKTALLDEGEGYMRIYAGVLFLSSLNSAYSSSLQTLGITKVALIGTIISIIVNSTLDIVLVEETSLGIEGLAIATVGVEFALQIMYFAYIRKNKIKELYLNFKIFFKIEKDLIIKVLKNWQMLVMNISYSLAILVSTLLMARAYDGSSHNPGAIMGIISPFTSLLFAGITGFGAAIYYFIGSELGKGNFETAKQNARKIFISSLLIVVALTIVISGLAYWGVMIFTKTTFDTKDQGRMILYLYGTVMPAFIVGWVSYTIISVGGQSKATVIFDTLFLWVIYVGSIALIFFVWNPDNFWLAWIIGQTTWWIRGIVGYLLYKQELWVVNLTESKPKKMVGFSYWLQVVSTFGIYWLIHRNKKK